MDELTLEEEERLEESAPFTEEGIMQLRFARPEVGHRLVDDSSSSDDDSTVDFAETASKKPPSPPITSEKRL